METDVIQDHGCGPEIVGTRITVYNLLPHFLDATLTETAIAQLYELTPEQVAAARAYVLNHADSVLTEHLKIEAKLAQGNPPEVIEQARQTHATLLKFKQWLGEREQAEAQEAGSEMTGEDARNGSGHFPTFREWLKEREARAVTGS